MSKTKTEHNPLTQEIRNLLIELKGFKTKQFRYLKQPEFAQIKLTKVTGLSSPDTKAARSNLGLEINEAERLEVEINNILKALESEFNEASAVKNSAECATKQIAVLETHLKALGPKFWRLVALENEVKTFSKAKRQQYAAKRDEVLKHLGSMPIHAQLKKRWLKAKQVVKKEFSDGESEPTAQDYADLLNADAELQTIAKLKKNRRTVKIDEVSEGEFTKELTEAEFTKELTDLRMLNAALVSKISTNLQVLRQLEETRWQALSLSQFKQNNAFEQLEGLYKSTLENQSDAREVWNKLVNYLKAKPRDTFYELVGEKVKEAVQIKQRIDEHFLQFEQLLNTLKDEETSSNELKKLRSANNLLEQQNSALTQMLQTVNPLFNEIDAIEKSLVEFKQSDNKEQLYTTKKSKFYDTYEPLSQELTELQKKLDSQLKGKNGPVIAQLKKSLDQLMQQLNKAEGEIASVKDPELKNYSHLLNRIFELKDLKTQILPLIEQIYAVIPAQAKENKLREEFAQKKESLLETYKGLQSPLVIFKDEKIRKEALEILTASSGGFRFAKDLVDTPIEHIQSKLEEMNRVIWGLDNCLGKSKITKAKAKHNFMYFSNKNAHRADPVLLDAVRELAKGENFREGHFTGELNEVSQLQKLLAEQEFVVVDEQLDTSDISNLSIKSSITFWSREELIAYCEKLAEFADNAFEQGIYAYVPEFNGNDFKNYQQAMAFNYQQQLVQQIGPDAKPNQFINQLYNYFYATEGDSEELDQTLTALYQKIGNLKADFQKQYPKINNEVLSAFMQQLQFSEDLNANLDEGISTLFAKQKSGELQTFLADHLNRYSALQQRVALPDSKQFESYNFSELSELKESRDYIAKAYKLHWLSVVNSELAIEQKFNPGSSIAKDLRFLHEKLNKWPLHFFVNDGLMANFASRLAGLKEQRAYTNLCQFHHIQEIALGRKSAMEPVELDWSETTLEEKMEVIHAKISDNRANSSAPLDLGIPEDLSAAYQRNKAFIEGMGLVLDTDLNFADDQQLIQQLADPLWREKFEQDFRAIIFAEPKTDEICTGLLTSLAQFSETTVNLNRFHRKLDSLDAKRVEIINGFLAAYPVYEAKSPSNFFGGVDQWRQVQIALQKWPAQGGNELGDRLKDQDISQILRGYKQNRSILLAAKTKGFDPEVNYKDLLQELEKAQQILEAALEFNRQMEAQRKELVGDLLDNLSKAHDILMRLSGRVNSMWLSNNDLTDEQTELLKKSGGRLNSQMGMAASWLNEIQMTPPYSGLGQKVNDATAFLNTLPATLINEVANAQIYSSLDQAGKGDFDKFVDWLKEAIEDLCKVLHIEFSFDPKLGRVYESQVSELVSEIDDCAPDAPVSPVALQA
ncbi:hypothetical protein BN59_02036 [Legionella massiliensis]|uniref:Uncharacterized protein n=1 Tax=Legionella massiliensis TaxID=1034943 RepID=A0A078KXP4_9GAMM|nr:hypothetical protein [Legionella massiliensis]CDZ77746.1 hypothetical protein BN59_02036 [Legionella massiliensis]CEE13484.1 hypothetical protein BN1094_02036 [Legionella massiliensis]